MSKSSGGSASGGSSSKGRSSTTKQTVTKTKARTMGSVEDEKLIVLRAALFDAAGADVDCLAPFAAFKDLKLSEEETLTVSFGTGKSLPREDMKRCFAISKLHMEDIYDESEYGWDDDDKKSELKDASSRLLVAKNPAGEIVGFVAFIMTLQGEPYEKPIGETCMLVRDLHVVEAYQRKGVGRHLMRLCEMIGMKFGLGYVEALVTAENDAAHAFFASSKVKGFSTDGREELLMDMDGDWDDDSFTVYSKCVSKVLKHAAKIQAQQAQEAAQLAASLSAALAAGVNLGAAMSSPAPAGKPSDAAAAASPSSVLDAATKQ